MRKQFLLTFLLAAVTAIAFSQSDKFWSVNNENKNNIATGKAVARLNYPKEFKLFNLSVVPFRQELFTVVDKQAKKSTVISLPNAAGSLEQFEIFESSNFEPALQAQFPEIRAYSGRGITDKSATLKLSISPQGVQSMVFRTDRDNEFIEPYSQDRKVYSVYSSHRDKGQLPWTCSTVEQQMNADIQLKVNGAAALTGSSNGTLKTMRLAQSCNGEYSNFFGATSSAQVGLVLAAFNATLTRCNGVYEKDLALHLNLIANTTAVIYYNPSTDPYTTLSNWNNQLQSALNANIGDANYDIGHMFGASGGGGNAGCIGCVCVNGSKGRGITSPADAIPEGDNFDIDYVAHEVGHQLGANHTFSMSNEGTGVNKEVGSGITIMGYAGITSYDVAPHSIDIFHQASIAQIQANLATKTCPVSVNMTANTAPVVAAVSNYTIPISTPFALTASATDAENDPLTYCWEQNDNSTTTGASSVASPTKATGPNWLSFPASVSGTRTFPKLSTILSGLNVTPSLPGGDAIANIEALSSVSRTLNFRVTVKDNKPYVDGSTIGQTAFTDAVVTVSNTSGPFAVTSPNLNITWNASSSATVTWSVNNTTAAPVSCTNINILLSTDGGNTFPIILASGTPNDGSEPITVPNNPGTTNRIKVEAVGNIFFDISNANFTIGAPPVCGDVTGLGSTVTINSATVSWSSVASAIGYDVEYKANSSSTWLPVATNTTDLTVDITGLSSGTLYDWRVRADCNEGSGNFIAAQFTTTSVVVPCPGTYDGANNGSTINATPIPLNTEIKGTISARGDNDYYSINITTGGSIIISLTTLPANYDLSLLNSSGSTLVTSQNNGTANETINTNVSIGIYYIRVFPKANASNATSCYTLNAGGGLASRGDGGGLITANNIEVNLFPNPASNKLNITIDGMKENAEIKVYNVMGKMMMKQIATKANSELVISKLPAGIYMINAAAAGRGRRDFQWPRTDRGRLS